MVWEQWCMSEIWENIYQHPAAMKNWIVRCNYREKAHSGSVDAQLRSHWGNGKSLCKVLCKKWQTFEAQTRLIICVCCCVTAVFKVLLAQQHKHTKQRKQSQTRQSSIAANQLAPPCLHH